MTAETRAETPKPPIVARMLPVEKRLAFLEIREALFDTGRLTGDQADVWAWQIVMEDRP